MPTVIGNMTNVSRHFSEFVALLEFSASASIISQAGRINMILIFIIGIILFVASLITLFEDVKAKHFKAAILVLIFAIVPATVCILYGLGLI